MKSILRLLLASVFASAVAAGSAYAEEVKTKVSFDFVAGDHSYPAGDYVVQVNLPDDPAMMTIARADGSEWTASFVEPALQGNPSPESKLVFERQGDHEYLTEVMVGGEYTVWKVPTPDLQREMSKSASGAKSGTR